MWTYFTFDWAMCCLLRNEVDMFLRLFDGFVAHVSPTNGWVETIDPKTRSGAGDMPHPTAAANYISWLRNALVFENEDKLHLCWGLNPAWLPERGQVSVRQAPTDFGMLRLELKRSATSLALQYDLSPRARQAKPQQVLLHIHPKLADGIQSLQVNGKTRSFSPRQAAVGIDVL